MVRVRRAIGRPWVTLLAAGLLLADAGRQCRLDERELAVAPDQRAYLDAASRATVVGDAFRRWRWLARPVERLTPSIRRWYGDADRWEPRLGGSPNFWMAVREGGGLRLLRPDEESWDEAARILTERPGDVISGNLLHTAAASGWWAPTRWREVASLGTSVEALRAAGWTVEEIRTAHALALAPRRARGRLDPRVEADLLRGAEFTRERTLWWGVANTAAAAVVAGVLAGSLGWVPAAVVRLAGRRRRRRLERGECPSCGYQRAGLAPDAPCPECGAPSPTA